MEYTFLGKSGLQVPRLCFGTMTFGGSHGFETLGNVPAAEAKRQIDICLDAGLNFFDTAEMHSRGTSEEILGQAIGSQRRDKTLIATKAFFRMGEGLHDVGLSRMHIIRACEASLKRLKTDYIDLYQVHNFDALTPLVLQIKSFNSYFQFKAPRLNDPKFARISLYERIFDRSTPGTFNLKIAVKTFDLEY